MTATERPPAGLSVWEAEVYQHLQAHLEHEAELLEAYEQLGLESGSDAVGYVVRLILEDESRHHVLITELLNTLRATVERVDEAQVPLLQGPAESPSRELAARTDELIRFEREDARALKRLIRELEPVRDTTLWVALLEAMQLDTEKHLRLLRFIRKHVRP